VFSSHILQLHSAVTVRTTPGKAGISYVTYNVQFDSRVTPHLDGLLPSHLHLLYCKVTVRATPD